MNRELIALDFDDPPVVEMTVLQLDAETGRFVIARAGAPRPVLVPESGPPVEISLPGPLLGVFDAAGFTEHSGEMRPGEKLVLMTDGTPTFTKEMNLHEQPSDDATYLVLERI